MRNCMKKAENGQTDRVKVEVNIGDNESSIMQTTTLKVYKHLIDPRKMEYLEKDFFSPCTMVPDVYRYIAFIKKGELTLGQHLKSDVRCTRFLDHRAHSYPKSMVLLLESPHSNEYCYRNDEMYPIAPAQGTTGDNLHLLIYTYLKKAIPDCVIKDGFYPVIIVNPIPWQTSLDYVLMNCGKMNKTVKEEVWRKIWVVPGVKEHFKTRLDSYKPRLFINACTGGKFSRDESKTTLNNLVYRYLHANFSDVKIVNTYHPSSPSFCSMNDHGQPRNYWIV